MQPSDSDPYLPPDSLPIRPKPTPGFLVIRYALGPLVRLLFRFDVKGRENIPKKGPFVVIANHLGWLDPIALLLSFPNAPRLHFLGDPEGLVTKPVQWRIVTLFGGYIPVYKHHRSGSPLYHVVDTCLERNGAIALFPEGKFGPGEGTLGEFHSGFAHFATDAACPIVPVGLFGTGKLWLFKTVNLTIGPAFPPCSTIDETVEEGREAVTRLIRTRKYAGPHLFERILTNLLITPPPVRAGGGAP